jgi:peptidoglycan/LPS O-acetylase OafA/YrhL
MQEIRPLTSLRGIFACWVVAVHIFNTGLGGVAHEPWIVAKGYLAVDFFFFLSGFILAGTYGARMMSDLSVRSYLDFVLRRWGRLFPLHIAVVAAMVVANPVYAPMRVLEELTLTQRWLLWPVGPVDWINMPSWSISTEWAASLLFPAFVWGGLRASRSRAALMAAASVALLVYSAADHHWNLNIWASSVTYLPLLRCFADFGLGVVGFRCRGAVAPLTSDRAVLALGAVYLLALALEASDLTIVAIVFPTVLGIAGNKGRAAKLLSAEPIHWLGTISYSIYLTHFPLVLLFRSLWPDLSATGNAVAYGVATAAATLGVASLTYRFIEVPCRDWVKTLAGRVQIGPAARILTKRG